MKKVVAKIWVPLLLVTIAAVQSFGIDAHRAVRLWSLADLLVLTRQDDSTAIETATADSLRIDSLFTDLFAEDSTAADSSAVDTSAIDTLFLTARDTIKVPDSLKETDPFFYKYYIAVKDSTTRFQVRDSLIMAGDSLELMKFDSLYIKDSTEVAIAKQIGRAHV